VDLVKRKPPKLAAVALANKTARIAWKLMISGEHYDRTRSVGRSEAPVVDREERRAALCGGSAQRSSLRSRATPAKRMEMAKA
jgi:transposase